jgi:hypothetical protein
MNKNILKWISFIISLGLIIFFFSLNGRERSVEVPLFLTLAILMPFAISIISLFISKVAEKRSSRFIIAEIVAIGIYLGYLFKMDLLLEIRSGESGLGQAIIISGAILLFIISSVINIIFSKRG